MRKAYMFTSESVTMGHPDKLCDQISDAIVDHILLQDPCAKVRAESAVSSAIVFIAARFATSAKVDLPHIARKVIKRVGYDQADFNSKNASILTAPQGFPPDKEAVFNEHELSDAQIDKIPARHQVTVFGYACDQTANFMPLPIWLARQISRQLDTQREKKTLSYLTPDAKVQVGVEFRDRKPVRIHSVTIAASQHDEDNPSQKTLHDDIMDAVLKPVFENSMFKPDDKTRIFINPEGPILGGPSHHSGLTGRKNHVDTYGEYSRQSGNALSGKDPTRIDRVGAYAARYAAKNVVAAGLASECEVTLSYSIGLTRPVSLLVDTHGSGTIPDEDIRDILARHFDFRLAGILKDLNLRRLPQKYPLGFYQNLAAYGHFGRMDMDLPWEKIDRVEQLKGD